MSEEQQKIVRMNVIYSALENGWSIKKSVTDSKTFEFTKNQLLDDEYKGLVVFSKSDVCKDIQSHLENIKKNENKKIDEKGKRSVSTPIIKNKEA